MGGMDAPTRYAVCEPAEEGYDTLVIADREGRRVDVYAYRNAEGAIVVWIDTDPDPLPGLAGPGDRAALRVNVNDTRVYAE